jgi:hypothetical protein
MLSDMSWLDCFEDDVLPVHLDGIVGSEPEMCMVASCSDSVGADVLYLDGMCHMLSKSGSGLHM